MVNLNIFEYLKKLGEDQRVCNFEIQFCTNEGLNHSHQDISLRTLSFQDKGSLIKLFTIHVRNDEDGKVLRIIKDWKKNSKELSHLSVFLNNAEDTTKRRKVLYKDPRLIGVNIGKLDYANADAHYIELTFSYEDLEIQY